MVTATGEKERSSGGDEAGTGMEPSGEDWGRGLGGQRQQPTKRLVCKECGNPLRKNKQMEYRRASNFKRNRSTPARVEAGCGQKHKKSIQKQKALEGSSPEQAAAHQSQAA